MIGIGFSNNWCMTGANVGIGNVFAGLLGSIARNPSLRGELFKMTILGFTLTEAIAHCFL